MSHGPQSLWVLGSWLSYTYGNPNLCLDCTEKPAYHSLPPYNTAVFPCLPIKGESQGDEIPPVNTDPGFTSLRDDGRQENTFFSCYPKALNFIDLSPLKYTP